METIEGTDTEGVLYMTQADFNAFGGRSPIARGVRVIDDSHNQGQKNNDEACDRGV
jgi:hypothetical protein